VTQHATSGLYVYYKVVTIEKALSLRDIEAPKTLANFLERKTQLYEQGATVRRIGQYVRNWYRWVRAGVEISYPYKMKKWFARCLVSGVSPFCEYTAQGGQ
jgi:hypothetical protein